MSDTQAAPVELAALVRQAQAGEREALDALVRRCQDMAVGYAYSLLGDWEAAQDAAQDAFIQVYHDLPKLRAPEAFLVWFRRIIFKHCDRQWRGRRPEAAPLAARAPVALEDGPARAAEEREAAAPLRRALAMLPEAERSALVLFYYQDASLKDMAAFLEITPSVADHRLRAARKHLSERLLAMTQQDLQDNRPSNAPQFALRVMDSLTRLANATGLDVRLREEIQFSQASGQGFGLVLFDVDEFKPFNDHRGHAAGDALLTALARQVQAVAMPGDYAARYAADELGLVLRRAPAQAVVAAAEQVRAAVAGTDLSLGTLLAPEARYGPGAPQAPPSPANAQFQRGLQRLQSSHLGEAAEAFQAALAVDANHIPSIMELAYLDLRRSLSMAQLSEPFRVTLSGGVSVYRVGDTPETLIARADAGLGGAKRAGRNQVQLGG